MKLLNFPAMIAVAAGFSYLVASPSSAYAADYVWTGAKTAKAGSWSVAKNWKKLNSVKLSTNTLGRATTFSAATTEPAPAIPGPGDTATITNGATVSIENAVTLANLTVEGNSTVRGAGDITVTSSLTLNDAQLSGEGEINIPVAATATLSSQETSTNAGNVINKVIDNNGVIDWTSGDLILQKDFHNTGDFNVKTDGDIKMSGMVSPTLYNTGTLTTSGTSGDADIDVAVRNSGDIFLQSGSLDVGPRFIQNDGTLNLDGGNLSSEGTLQIDGGVVQGTGTLACNVAQNGGRFKPGHSPGIITINGNYIQASTAFLDMEIGGLVPGTGHDQMIIWGLLDLQGTLDLIKYNSFLPIDGDNIELMQYNNCSQTLPKVTGKYPGGQIYYEIAKTSISFFACAIGDTAAPTALVTNLVHGQTYQGVASVKGTCVETEQYRSGIKKVTARLYRYPTATAPAGYWLGGSSWSATWSPANELPTVGLANWSLAFPPLPPGKYLTRGTGTDNVGNWGMSPNVIFYISATSGTFANLPERPKKKDSLLALGQTRKFYVSSRS